MGHEWEQCLLLQLLPINGRVGKGMEQGPAVKFPVLKLSGTRYGRGSREVGVEGGAEVSECFSGTGWGGVLGSAQWSPALKKEGGRRGRKVEVVEMDLKQLQGDWER